MIVQIHTCS